MAGDWIKMRCDLHTHPKIVRIASALNADNRPHAVRPASMRCLVVGALHAVWSVFDAHSEDGKLDGYSPETIDDLVGCPGISRAMEAVGWLEISGSSVSLPRFAEHNGKSAKRRATESDRKRAERAEQRKIGDENASGSSPDPVRKVSASDADEMRTREEKRRERERESNNARRGTRLPPDWAPDDDLREWAKNERPDLDVDTVLDRFRDHWVAQPGAKGVKLDWSATFRNWVRNEKAETRRRGGSGSEDLPWTGAI